MAFDNERFRAAMAALGGAVSTGNYGNVGRDMTSQLRGNAERTANTQQKELLQQNANRTAAYLQSVGANPQLVQMAQAGQGGQAYKIFQDAQKVEKPVERKFTADANKQKRYTDTGELVFPNVTANTGGKQPTLKQRNELGTAEAAISSLDNQLDAYSALVAKTGNTYLPGAERDSVQTMRRNIQMQMKELFNLGVLNGPDLELMDQMLYDAAPGGGKDDSYFDKPAAMVQEGLGSLGIMNTPAERAKANAEQLKSQFKQLLQSKQAAYGGGQQQAAQPIDTMGAPQQAQQPMNIQQLSDEELSRIANGG